MTKEEEIIDLKQVIFRLETELSHTRWDNANNDISFLKEMKQHAKKAFEKKDIGSYDMLNKMIGDWMDELIKQT